MTLEEARTASNKIELLENALQVLVRYGLLYRDRADTLIGSSDGTPGFQLRFTAALLQGMDALEGNPEPTRDFVDYDTFMLFTGQKNED